MDTNAIILIFIISLICCSVHFVTRQGNLLHGIKVFTQDWPYWITKPMHDCVLCMGGVWGVSLFLLFNFLFHLSLPWYWAVIVPICVIGLNGIVALLEGILDGLTIIAKYSRNP